MKAASIVLTVVGALLGPGYYFYCDFSGRTVGSYHTGEGLTFQLEPRMNPVAIDISIGNSGVARNYWASLDLGGKKVGAIGIHASENATTSATMHVNVAQPGEYRFRIEESAWPGQWVLGKPVKVRRNAHIVDLRIAGVGLLLFVIGLLMNTKYGKDEPR